MEGLVVVALLYFLPALIALLRGHHNGFAIFLTNVLLGWIVALIWSTTASQPRVRV